MRRVREEDPRHDRRRRPRNGGMSAEERKRARKIQRFRMAGVRAWAVVMILGMAVGLLWFARPTHSALENRDLEPFPTLSAGEFLDGTYFSNMAKWYSDTYPFRESLVGAGRAVSSLYGLRSDEQMIGGNVVADELPPVEDGEPGDAGGSDADAGAAAPVQPVVDEGPVEMPDARVMAEEIQGNIMEGLYVKDGAAYNMYYFTEEPVARYASAINLCAESLDGVANVYSMLVPNSSGALLDEETLAALGGSDQRQAIRYFNSLYSDKVHPVFIYDTLREHNDEYIYFRTDHHWTQLGAYYGYVDFCAAKGTTPTDLNKLQHMRFEPFLGSFYTQTGDAGMEANPDYVDAWVPAGTNDLVFWDEEGNEYEGNVITDATTWDPIAKTGCFIEDYPLTKIENPAVQDDSACLIIKDSYGCFFASLLVDDYHTVWVIDPRYSNRNIPQFVRENGINDVIFLNNVTLASTNGISSALMNEIQEA